TPRSSDLGAERAALARQHHGADERVRVERLPGLSEGLEHGDVEGVQLVGAVEPNVGDSAVDLHGHTVGHAVTPVRRAITPGTTIPCAPASVETAPARLSQARRARGRDTAIPPVM